MEFIIAGLLMFGGVVSMVYANKDGETYADLVLALGMFMANFAFWTYFGINAMLVPRMIASEYAMKGLIFALLGFLLTTIYLYDNNREKI